MFNSTAIPPFSKELGMQLQGHGHATSRNCKALRALWTHCKIMSSIDQTITYFRDCSDLINRENHSQQDSYTCSTCNVILLLHWCSL